MTTGILALSLLMAGGATGIATDEPPGARAGGTPDRPRAEVRLPLSGVAEPCAPRQESPAPPAEAERIDVNEADAVELQEVPGIGPVMAQRIVEFREEFGPFERLEDLLDVRGIGLRTLERIRPYLRVGDRSAGLAAA